MAGRFFCEKTPRFLCASMWKFAFCCTFPPLFIPLPLSTFHLFPRRLHPILSLLSFLPQSLNLFLTFSTRFSTVFRILFPPLHFFTKNIAVFPRVYFRFFPFILRIFIDFNKSTTPTTITILLILSFLPFPSLEGMV